MSREPKPLDRLVIPRRGPFRQRKSGAGPHAQGIRRRRTRAAQRLAAIDEQREWVRSDAGHRGDVFQVACDYPGCLHLDVTDDYSAWADPDQADQVAMLNGDWSRSVTALKPATTADGTPTGARRAIARNRTRT